MGADRCAAEFLVTPLREFLDAHTDLYFPHRHSFYQIVLFTRGGGSHSIDFQRFEAREHQVYYMAPGQIHTWEFTAETEGLVINFNETFFTAFCHNPNFLAEFPLFNAVRNAPVNVLDMECCGEVHGLMEKMLLEYRSDEGDFKADLLRAMLLQLLVRLSRKFPERVIEGATRHHVNMLRNFERLIEQHFREKHLPREYAELMFITPNHLNALASATIGKPAGELIRDRIILEAKRLLVNSDYTISQIASHLNFEDNAYFSRFFKKALGISPEQFRRSKQSM